MRRYHGHALFLRDGIEEDKNGLLWIATTEGVDKINLPYFCFEVADKLESTF